MATIKDRYILEVDTKGARQNLGGATTAIGGLGAAIGKIGPLAVAAGAALGGMAVVKGIGNTIEDMDNLAKAARNVGAANADSFDDFQVISQQLGEMGLSSSETDRALRNLTTRMAQAAETGKGPAADAFAKLGDSVLDANGKLLDMPELYEAVTGAIQDGSLSITDAQKILGEMVGPKILGGFQDLADKGVSVSESLADVRANSNIVSLDSATQAEAFGDTMGRLSEVAGRLGTKIVEKLLPVLLNLAEGALAILPGFIDGVGEAFGFLSPILDAVIEVWKAMYELLQTLWPVFEVLFSVIKPVAEIIGGALVLAIKTVTAIIETVVDTITGFVQGIRDIGTAVGELTGQVGDKFAGMKDSVVGSAKGAYDGVTGWFGDMYDEVVGNSIVPDMAQGVLGEFLGMEGGMIDSLARGVQGVKDGFIGIAQGIASGFDDATGGALSNIASQVDTIASSVFSKISSLGTKIDGAFGGVFSDVGSALGGAASGISDALGLDDAFAGFFANGGAIPAGQFGVVGEAGAELVSGPATVTPAGAFGTNVTYNINAVDAASFRSLVARDPEFIHQVAQRGSRSIPARR